MPPILFPERAKRPATIAEIKKILFAKITINYPAILARVAGLILLAAAIVLLHLFLENPRGTLPGFPEAWSGGPLILGSAFLASCGAYLLVMRRYTLSGLMLAGLAAGTLATCVHSFVSNITEITRAQDSVRLPTLQTREFVERSRHSLTPERLKSLAIDAKNSGYLKHGLDFHSANVTYSAANDGSDVIVTINFHYSPYLHPRPTGARSFVAAYTRLLNSWTAARVERKEEELAKGTAKALYQHSHPDAYFPDPYKYLDLDFLRKMRRLNDSAPEPTRQNLRWVLERESDPRFKEILASISKQLDELEDNPPPKPPPPKPPPPRPQAAVV